MQKTLLKNFQPSPGIIATFATNHLALEQEWTVLFSKGCKITPYYDSLICKLICKGRNRTEAIQRTMRSLNEFVIEVL